MALLRQNAPGWGWGNGAVLTLAQLCGQNDALVRKMMAFISPRTTAHAGPPKGCPEGGLGENKIVYFTGSLLETSQGRVATLDAAVLAHTVGGSRHEGGTAEPGAVGGGSWRGACTGALGDGRSSASEEELFKEKTHQSVLPSLPSAKAR